MAAALIRPSIGHLHLSRAAVNASHSAGQPLSHAHSSAAHHVGEFGRFAESFVSTAPTLVAGNGNAGSESPQKVGSEPGATQPSGNQPGGSGGSQPSDPTKEKQQGASGNQPGGSGANGNQPGGSGANPSGEPTKEKPHCKRVNSFSSNIERVFGTCRVVKGCRREAADQGGMKWSEKMHQARLPVYHSGASTT